MKVMTQDKVRIIDFRMPCTEGYFIRERRMYIAEYKRLYPPGRPEDDTYWQGMMKELEVLRKNYHHSRLCEDLLCAVVRDLETKSKRSNPAASMKE